MINRERGPQDHDIRGQGVYEPVDDVRVYDAAEDEEDEEGSRLPLLIVLALVVLAMFAGVVYLAYTQGVARGRGEVPVLAAAGGPARVAPGQPGGTKVPYQGFKIYEQPAPPDDQVGDSQAADTTARTATQAAPAKPAPTQPTAKPEPSPAKPAAPAKTPAKAEASASHAASEAPRTEQVQASRTQADHAQAGQMQAKATAAPRSLAQGAPAPAKPVPAQPVSAAPGGAYFLQVGAFKSQADAEAAWNTYKARHATLLAGHGLDVQRVDLGSKGVWYRARVGGFPNHDVAQAMCDRLKADGGACFLVH